jgi:transposase
MQGEAGIHWSHAVAAFLQRHHINTIDWPPYLPDLNPIEHLWWRLKRLMFKHSHHITITAELKKSGMVFVRLWRSAGGAYLGS